MDLSKWTREDWMVLGGGVLLIIGLFAFSWYSGGGYSAAATSQPYAIWGVLALIVTMLIVIDVALARYCPDAQIPTTRLGRELTRVAACGVLVLLLFIKFLAHGGFGYGFFLDVILTAIVCTGCWFMAEGRAAPLPRRPARPARSGLGAPR